MDGARGAREKNLTFARSVRVQPCIRPLNAAVLAVYLACLCDHRKKLSPGERGLVLFLAQNVKQANVAFSYASAVIDSTPLLADLVTNRTADTISLANGVDLEIRSASFRGLRGITAVAVIADEAAFWFSDELSANADTEILNAVRPCLATTGGPLVVISSPYGKAGAVYEAWRAHYGPNGDPKILVAQGASRDFNPSLPQSVVDRALQRDPEKATAEYLGQFRGDVAVFVSREALDGCVSLGVYERAPVSGVRYLAFVDPSGGSSDSMTLAICHREKDGMLVLDCVREKTAPFSPESVVLEFAQTLKSYHVTRVRGDRYGGEWPSERFKKLGVEYFPIDKVKSDLYLAALPLIMGKRVDLLDNQRLLSQIAGLERRTGRGGKDSVDHRPGTRDDLANAVCGALYMGRETFDQPIAPGIFYTHGPRHHFGDHPDLRLGAHWPLW